MHNKGFTLIELLVTISILSVVMALAVITIDKEYVLSGKGGP
jgi:prepilin-type N-terminal cleavage/methylation domain-containing protein